MGSQIVAISEKKCSELMLSYDPTKRVPLVSANGATEYTLGIARDVPVELNGGIVLYLQMHVVRNASYDILLELDDDDDGGGSETTAGATTGLGI